jgi:hypothetical protein
MNMEVPVEKIESIMKLMQDYKIDSIKMSDKGIYIVKTKHIDSPAEVSADEINRQVEKRLADYLGGGMNVT